MAVPNHFSVVQHVWSTGHYDLTTKIGCGRFVEDVAFALKSVDPNWGHLKKPNSLGGANKWNGHAVDNVCYRSSIPGQTTAVDIVRAGESDQAVITWNPDDPRYQPTDWLEALHGDTFVLPQHHCALGCSMFWLVGAIHRARHGEPQFYEKVDRNCAWATEELGADYLRFMLALVGKGDPDPWTLIGGDPRWPDFEETVAEATDRIWSKFSLYAAPTLVGEGLSVPTTQDKENLVQLAARIFGPRHTQTFLVEIWNERWMTDGDEATIRWMAQRLHQLAPDLPIALDSPIFAADTDPEDRLPGEVTRFYGGSVARVITPQWNRSEPNPRDMGPDCPAAIISHEPRGPGASNVSIIDPLPLVHDYIQTAIASQIHGAGPHDGVGYTYHSMPGAFGGYAYGYPAQNVYPDLWTVPNAAAIAAGLKSVRQGALPDIGTPPPNHGGGDMPLKSREKFYEEFTEINRFYEDQTGLKRPGGMVIDTASPVEADTQAMAAWGYDLLAGKSVDQVKHDICQSDEWKSKHPGETPPY